MKMAWTASRRKVAVKNVDVRLLIIHVEPFASASVVRRRFRDYGAFTIAGLTMKRHCDIGRLFFLAQPLKNKT